MRIAIVDENPARASIIEEGLAEIPECELHKLTQRQGLLAQLGLIDPDIVLMDLGNPSRDVLEEYFAVSRALARPIAMFVDESDDDAIAASIDAGVSAYVVDGLSSGRIRSLLDLVRGQVRLVSVGKRSGRHSKDQKTIDTLIVEAALAGERVVRLKGGDPSIFGRATEELHACRVASVPVRICPGVTAASAAAAGLGLSLTLPGLARRLTFVTAHTAKGQVVSLDWPALADPEATLAIYMGKAAAPQVAAGLLDAGLAADTPVAMVENASLDDESHVITRLDLLPLAARTALAKGPALILIGRALARPDSADGSVAGAADETAQTCTAPQPIAQIFQEFSTLRPAHPPKWSCSAGLS